MFDFRDAISLVLLASPPRERTSFCKPRRLAQLTGLGPAPDRTDSLATPCNMSEEVTRTMSGMVRSLDEEVAIEGDEPKPTVPIVPPSLVNHELTDP